jgi:hypothetical protein
MLDPRPPSVERFRSLRRRYRSVKDSLLSVSHRLFDDFEFIHINRTGGTSIVKALRLPFEHRTALEIIERIGQAKWDRLLSFTVVRNPWDKVVSDYHHRILTNKTGLGVRTIPFGEWVRHAYQDQNPTYFYPPLMFAPQIDWICAPDGSIAVDYVCRFENLENDFETVARRINRRVALPHLNRSNHGHYRDYYDNETAAIVKRWFLKDIEAFGYTFESGLPKAAHGA